MGLNEMKTFRSSAIALVTSLALIAACGVATGAEPSQAERNKQLVLTAYQGLFGDHDLTVVDKYWAEDYIQHNPYVSDGRDSLKTFVRKLGIENWPKTQVRFLRVAADGDLVFLQTMQPKMAQSPERVIVDIFRVANGKIAEHWDTMQAVPADATNPRPMY